MNPEGADRAPSLHLFRTPQGRGEEETAFLYPHPRRPPPRSRLTPAGPGGPRRCSPWAERPRPGPGPAMAAPPRSNQPPRAAHAHWGPRAAPARARRAGQGRGSRRSGPGGEGTVSSSSSTATTAPPHPRPNTTGATGPLRATSNTGSDGGRPCPTSLSGKKLLLLSNLNLPSHSVSPCPIVLSLVDWEDAELALAPGFFQWL